MNKVWKNILSTGLGLTLMSTLTFSFATVDQAQILRENDCKAEVFELQRALNELGYFSSSDFTNLYGKQTVEAVKAFQKSLQMTPDGVSGKVTLAALRDHQVSQRKKENLKLGVTHARVLVLGKDLKELGYFSGEPSQSFTAELENALGRFQKASGLTADGKAGDVTLEAITEALIVKRNYTSENTGKTTENQTQIETKTSEVATTSAGGETEKKTTSVVASRGAEAVRKSKDFLGIGYVYGGASASGFDCSGFTMFVMKQFDISLPHGATAQFGYGTAVEKEDLMEGDLVFFKTTDAPIGHVGIYVGDGQFIHASSAKSKIIISSLKTYGGKYVGARRVL